MGKRLVVREGRASFISVSANASEVHELLWRIKTDGLDGEYVTWPRLRELLGLQNICSAATLRSIGTWGHQPPCRWQEEMLLHVSAAARKYIEAMEEKKKNK